MENISADINKRFSRKPPKGIHSGLHAFIDEIRKEYGETATKGKGSFGFYLGMLKRFDLGELYRIRAEIQQSGAHTPKKLFWWKIGQEMKRKREGLSRGKVDK